MKLRPLLLTSFFAILLVACSDDGMNQFTWVTSGQQTLTGSTRGDLMVLGGEVVLPEGSQLEGSLYQLSGKVSSGGEIQGDVFLLGGELALEPTAHLLGRLNMGSSLASISRQARIEGEVSQTAPVQPAPPWSSGLGGVLRRLSGGVLLGVVAILLQQFAPDAARRVGTAALDHNLVSGSLGLLAGVVGLSLLITIAYTILLAPLSLIGLVGLGLAVAYGWAALGVRLGQLGQEVLKGRLSPAAAAFTGALAFFLLLEAISSLPVLGSLLGIYAALVSLGAVCLTRFGLNNFEPAEPGWENGARLKGIYGDMK